MIVRVDRDKYKLLQVTFWRFHNRYHQGLLKSSEIRREWGYPESYDGFWLNFDPDRLYEIEKDIVGKVELPKKLYKTFLVDDIWLVVSSSDICNVEKAREKRKKAIEGWKKASLKGEMPILGPPLIF